MPMRFRSCETPMSRRAVVVCDQWLGSNGFAAMKALRRAGWSVAVVPEREFVPVRWRSVPARVLRRLVRSTAVREFNRELLRQAQQSGAEFLFVFKGPYVLPATLMELRRRGVRCYCFYPDVSFHVHGPYLPRALPQYDWIFTTKRFGIADLREQLGVTHASVLLHAYDADLHRPVALSDADHDRYDCDVSFIGSWSPKKEELIHSVITALPSLKLRVWGGQWYRATMLERKGGVIAGFEVTGEEYVRAIQASSINLGILSERRRGASSGDNITSRTFHIPASGGFMLHERTAEVLEIFREDESIACYGSNEELITKLALHLQDPMRRGQIAHRGFEVVAAGHSWDHRIQEILRHHDTHEGGS